MTTSPARKIRIDVRVASLVCSCLIAAGLIGKLDQIYLSMLDQLSVGTLTTSTDQTDKKVLCVDLDSSQPCLAAHRDWQGKTVLWLGNSQLPTINQQQPDDLTMVELLHHSMINQGAYIFGFAPPNANLQEHYALLEHLKPRLKPDILLLPVFFDDLRETGIRPQLQEIFEDHTVADALKKTEIGRFMVEQNSEGSENQSTVQSLPQSTMETTEAGINEWLEARVPAWKSRGDYRATFFFQMHYLRNTVFQIDPQSVRRMIPARYERNIAALHAILDSASAQKIQVVMYVPPIRNDVPLPYDMVAYEQFKVDLEDLANERTVLFADLENIVAPHEWGTKTSSSIGGEEELDFMHFAFSGHKKMAIALQRQLVAPLKSQPASSSKIISVSNKKVVR